jgi:hypothetical protein
VLCTFLLGRVVRTYNKEFFYLTIIPICICSIALRAFIYFITSLQFYHSHVGLYFVRQSRALVGEFLGFVVSDEPKSALFFRSILQGSTSTPIVGGHFGMFTGVAHISDEAVPPTGKPLVIGEKSGHPILLPLIMRGKQELPKPKLFRPCMTTKQNNLMKRFFAQLEGRGGSH